jgi:hypothetical protein
VTIRKGQEWGHRGRAPEGSVLAVDDRALFRAVNLGKLPAGIALVSGDLARTVSAGDTVAQSYATGELTCAPIDLGLATHDNGTHRFAAHAVVRRSWLRGAALVVANAQFIGRWDVAPRSHPNDGWLDVTEVDARMPVRQRLAARRRLPTASHLPHPMLTSRRVRTHSWTFEQPLDLRLDGVRVGRTHSLSVSVLEDAVTICF